MVILLIYRSIQVPHCHFLLFCFQNIYYVPIRKHKLCCWNICLKWCSRFVIKSLGMAYSVVTAQHGVVTKWLNIIPFFVLVPHWICGIFADSNNTPTPPISAFRVTVHNSLIAVVTRVRILVGNVNPTVCCTESESLSMCQFSVTMILLNSILILQQLSNW